MRPVCGRDVNGPFYIRSYRRRLGGRAVIGGRSLWISSGTAWREQMTETILPNFLGGYIIHAYQSVGGGERGGKRVINGDPAP